MNPLPTPDLLRATAPPDLAPTVLFRVGLADEYLTVDSPVGPVFVARNGRGVSATAPAFDGAAADAFEATFAARFGRPIRPARHVDHGEVASLQTALREGRGRGVRFDLRATTPFGRAVLDAARRIPRGEIRPYGWIAREIGHPAAVRAVGSALGPQPRAAPHPVPPRRAQRRAHRRLRRGASAVKRAVLTTEGVLPDEVEREARAGLRYLGSDTTHIVCWPTCHHARSIQARHRVGFPTLPAAEAAGYRPCRDCRP